MLLNNSMDIYWAVKMCKDIMWYKREHDNLFMVEHIDFGLFSPVIIIKNLWIVFKELLSESRVDFS
jgi:hypothetical protein